MRPTVTRSCLEKLRHATRAAAEQHRWRLIDEGASRNAIHVYRCGADPASLHYHVGHRPRGRRKARNR